MKLLILGGTVFVGRHLVEAALARNHEVTLFNRGQHNAGIFPRVETLRGDRDGGLDPLKGRRWDAVVDTCGYTPRVVRASADLLSGAVDHYTFISSISVYRDVSRPGVDERGAVGTLEDTTTEEVAGDTYGPLKALCERAVEESMPGRTLVVRPGLIVGPHDPTDRFTYWPRRVAHGGDVLAPGRPDGAVQFIDVRDLAAWTLRMVEARHTGTYNATGPGSPLTMGGLLDVCNRESGGTARFVWVDEPFLLREEVGPWIELPLWIPDEMDMRGQGAIDCRKAIAAGLAFRPLSETVRDTLDWDATRPDDTARAAGLRPEREAELLDKWRAQT
jgi:2'-hydroxyisoflavone reductase